MNSELMHKIINYNNLLKSASKENCVANRSSVYPVNAHKLKVACTSSATARDGNAENLTYCDLHSGGSNTEKSRMKCTSIFATLQDN